MDFELFDTHEATDAHAAHRRASDAYLEERVLYRAVPSSVQGERLDMALRIKQIARRRLEAMGGEA